MYDSKRSKIFALLTAYSWPKRRLDESKIDTSLRNKYWLKNSRKVDLNSKILKNYEIIKKFTNTQMCTFYNSKDNEVVFSIRGTDLTRLEENDLYLDVKVLCGKEKESSRYDKCYNMLFEIMTEYKKSKICLCGSSLGGRIAIDLLDSDIGERLYEVHCFNCATSLCHLYNSTNCVIINQKSREKYCKKRLEKLHLHLINKDPISILSMGELSKTKTVYPRKESSSSLLYGKNKRIRTNHSILNFI